MRVRMQRPRARRAAGHSWSLVAGCVTVPAHVRPSSHPAGRTRRVDGDRDRRRLERGQRRLEGALQPRLGLRARGGQSARPARASEPARSAAEAARRRTRSKLMSRLAAGPRVCCVGARVPALCSVLRRLQTQATACILFFCVLLVLSCQPYCVCQSRLLLCRRLPVNRTTLTIGTLPLFLPRIRKRHMRFIACAQHNVNADVATGRLLASRMFARCPCHQSKRKEDSCICHNSVQYLCLQTVACLRNE
jgi:hypothetical protein